MRIKTNFGLKSPHETDAVRCDICAHTHIEPFPAPAALPNDHNNSATEGSTVCHNVYLPTRLHGVKTQKVKL